MNFNGYSVIAGNHEVPRASEKRGKAQRAGSSTAQQHIEVFIRIWNNRDPLTSILLAHWFCLFCLPNTSQDRVIWVAICQHQSEKKEHQYAVSHTGQNSSKRNYFKSKNASFKTSKPIRSFRPYYFQGLFWLILLIGIQKCARTWFCDPVCFMSNRSDLENISYLFSYFGLVHFSFNLSNRLSPWIHLSGS